MGKGMFVGIIAIVAVICFIVGAVAFGLIPGIDLGLNIGGDDDAPNDAEKLYMSDRDIFQSLEFLTGKNLTYTEIQPYIVGLHMQMWGINDQSAYDTLTWFENEYENDSYTSLGTTINRGSGWTAYTEGWHSGINSRAVSVGDGSAIKAVYGYDTMILTSHGPLTDYYDFWRVVSSS